jgi:cytochrome b subunit of formate dehydrogenase
MKYLIDLSMGIAFLICFITGLVKWPHKSFGKMISSHEITLVHDYAGIILGFVVLIHLIINRKWIITTTKRLFMKHE